jgi:hypothetical protein
VEDRTSLSRSAELASETVKPSEVAMRTDRLSRLVAATVSGGIDFETQQPKASEAKRPTGQGSAQGSGDTTIPMYRHPADRNAAATQVGLGKTVDLSG